MNASRDRSVLYERRDGAVWLTIDRPERRNALDRAVLAGLRAGLEAAQQDGEVRAIVLTGAGERAFCAGADLKDFSELDPSQPTAAYAELLRASMACTLPTIARVNGDCLAGGMGLLAACDLAVATDDARFGLPEVKVGLFPMQVFALLQRLVPPRVLAEMTLTGEPLGAREAHEVGLINHAVPRAELDSKVVWLLERLQRGSPTAQRRGKYAMRVVRDLPWEPALAYLESQLATLALTEDAREGRRAFVERRSPVWTGR